MRSRQTTSRTRIVYGVCHFVCVFFVELSPHTRDPVVDVAILLSRRTEDEVWEGVWCFVSESVLAVLAVS